MKTAFIKAWKVFMYLFLLFTLLYWAGVIVDDWVFIQNYWATNWPEYLEIWALYFLVYALAFTAFFWGVVTVAIVFYTKVIRSKD